MRIRTAYGLFADRRDMAILIFWIFIMCVSLYSIAGKKKVGQIYVDEWDEAQLEWEKNSARILLVLALSFLTMLCLSHCIRHNEERYQSCLFIFFCLLVILSVNLFKAVMVGVKLEYGHAFDR